MDCGSPPYPAVVMELSENYEFVIFALALCSLICIFILFLFHFSTFCYFYDHCFPVRRRCPPPPSTAFVPAIGGEAARRGLGAAVIASLPVVAFSLAGGRAAAEEKMAECPICLVEFADGEEVKYLSDCGHRFHVDCLDAWLVSHDTCPICRSTVSVSAGMPAEPALQLNLPPAMPSPSSSSSSSSYEHTIEMSRV